MQYHHTSAVVLRGMSGSIAPLIILLWLTAGCQQGCVCADAKLVPGAGQRVACSELSKPLYVPPPATRQRQLRLDRVSLVAALRGDWQSIPRHAWHVVQHRQACAQCPTVSHSVPLCHLPLLQWLQPWGDAPCRCAQHTGVAPALFVLVWGASSVTPRGQVWHELRSCWLWCTR